MYKSHLIDEKGTFSPIREKIVLRDFLASAFARSVKVMRVIDSLYYSDEKMYLRALKHSKYKNSRIITNVKYNIRENALRALAVIEISTNNDDVYDVLYDISRKSFESIFDKVMNSLPQESKLQSLVIDLANNNSDDVSLINEAGVFLFFYWDMCGSCKYFSPKDYAILNSWLSYSNHCLKSCSEYVRDIVKASDADQIIVHDLLNDSIIKEILKHRNIASMTKLFANIPQKLDNYMQSLWKLTQFDNVPASIYKDEQLTENDLLDLINIISLFISDKEITKDEAYLTLVSGIYIRSFSKMYNKLIDKLSNDATKNRLSYNETEKKLKLEINSIKDKYNEQVSINQKKQQELNTIQIKYDKSQNTINDLNSKIEELEEKNRILEALLERKDAITIEDIASKQKDNDTSILLNKNIVVFGGPPNWHTSVKKVLPNATCIPVSNKSFNTNIIDNSDIIVIKTDYLSHAQWYKVINQARNKNKKVLYCQNNIDILLNDLANTISVQDD